jgi:hypothetical protein
MQSSIQRSFPPPLIESRDSDSVSAFRPAAPSPHTVLARIVEKRGAVWIRATFQTGKISAAEQVSGGFSERNKKLYRLIQLKFESPFELPRSLDYLCDPRRLGDQEVDRINTSARNRPACDDPAQRCTERDSRLVTSCCSRALSRHAAIAR